MTDYYLVPPSRKKYAASEKPYTIDLKAYLRSYWIAGRAYNAGDFVRAPSVSGFAYLTDAAGEAGKSEPPWPRTLGGTVQDGSITWEAVLPDTNALDAISSVAWSTINPPDSALLISAQANTNEEASARISAGTAGEVYRVQCLVTTLAQNEYDVQFDLEIA